MQGGVRDEGILVLCQPISLGHWASRQEKNSKKIYIFLPEIDARKIILELNSQGTPDTLTDE
jgi:hypothetical protein